jgi:hypothetical protein
MHLDYHPLDPTARRRRIARIVFAFGLMLVLFFLLVSRYYDHKRAQYMQQFNQIMQNRPLAATTQSH